MNHPANRRQFLSVSAGVNASSTVWANLQALAVETDPDPHVLGQGKGKSRRDAAFTPKADGREVPVKDCHEMVRRKNGNLLFCANHTGNNLIEYSPDGKVARTFGATYPGAHGLTLADENGTEVLRLTDTVRRIVVKMVMDGREILTLGWPKESPLRLDNRGGAFQAWANGKPVIIKGDAAGSELMRRIKSAIEAEYQAIYAKGRVETTSGVGLGLTMGCQALVPLNDPDFVEAILI